MEAKTVGHRQALPVILIAAVLQGWALYALHMSIEHRTWPATSPGTLLALYAFSLFVPVTLQLFVAHVRQLASWLMLGALAIGYSYFAWHHGARVANVASERFVEAGELFPLGFVLVLLWLLTLPFMQCRLGSGTWRAPYGDLFATAWRNKLLLAEAAAFTGLFWLLLFLWQELFGLIGIEFFEELFEEPLFIYPVTSLCFGVGLHLIGSVDRLTSVVLEQVLGVLKWLAILAGFILALFSVALAFELPSLLFSGERAIDATWLLWLIAVTVLLVNAAYRDGSVEQPYPRWIALALRAVVPLTILIACTAVYALGVRVDRYGLTVERFWGFVVAAAALAYSVGYTFAALRRGKWMGEMGRVNVGVALGLIAIIALALTPVLSPYRLSAGSQYERALAADERTFDPEHWHGGPFHYLRFDAGRYGRQKLQALIERAPELGDPPLGTQIVDAARSALAQEQQWLPPVPTNTDALLDDLAIHPSGAKLDPDLRALLQRQLRAGEAGGTDVLGGVFVDLNEDGIVEFVLLSARKADLYQQQAGGWRARGQMMVEGSKGDAVPLDALERTLRAALDSGDVGAGSSSWRDLRIGKMTYRWYGP